jgi:hypothetical protein
MDRAADNTHQDEVSAEQPDQRQKPRRVNRRRLVKGAAVAAGAVVAASGYIQPSVRPLQAPVAHAFSF